MPPPRKKTIGGLLVSCEVLLSNMRIYVEQAEARGESGDDVKEMQRHLRNLIQRMEAIRSHRGGLSSKVCGTGTMVMLQEERRLLDRGSSNPAILEPEAPEVISATNAEAERLMRLAGRSSAAQIADLLQFLANSGRSGNLRIKTEFETADISIDGGYVIDAISSKTPDGLRLGDILLGRQIITEQQLRSILISTRESRTRLGLALKRTGLLAAEDLSEALGHQTRCLVERIMHASDMDFSFEESSDHQDGDIRINMTEILLDSARVIDENSRQPAGR